ncbi:protein kinase [Endozoicomonas sp. SCSIO W0465]|nr:protein kinase [Endozoicomonas sp. SCSIO W0465]
MKIGKRAQVQAWFSATVEGIVNKWRGRKAAIHRREQVIRQGRGIEFKKLGHGYWGTVSQYIPDGEGRINIVKKIAKKNYSDQEVKILETLSGSDHCVSIEEQWSDDKYHYIAMEDAGLDIGRLVYRKNGRVGVYKRMNHLVRIFKRNEGFKGINEINDERLLFKSVIFQSLEGLRYMHEKKIVHRDIKPSNIMITYTGQVRVGDFGCAVGVDEATRFNGDLRYQPPETSRLRKGSYTEKSDIWMLGATMTEMILGKSVIMGFFRFGPRNVTEIFARIDKASASERISKDTAMLLKSMLAANPDDRPSANELLLKDYFQKDLEKLNQLQKGWKGRVGDYPDFKFNAHE